MSKNRLLANLVSDNQPLANGSISVSDITDLNITSPAAGQILSWDAVQQKWKNAEVDRNIIKNEAAALAIALG